MSWYVSCAGNIDKCHEEFLKAQHTPEALKVAMHSLLELFKDKDVLLETSGHIEGYGGSLKIEIRNMKVVDKTT